MAAHTRNLNNLSTCQPVETKNISFPFVRYFFVFFLTTVHAHRTTRRRAFLYIIIERVTVNYNTHANTFRGHESSLSFA